MVRVQNGMADSQIPDVFCLMTGPPGGNVCGEHGGGQEEVRKHQEKMEG